MPTPNEATRLASGRAVLEVATRDPMAAVRHVAACLARRAYPLLGLSCVPLGRGTGRLVVAVADDGRIGRLLAELAGLPEVSGARLCAPDAPVAADFPDAPAIAFS
jgi:acetolactate synthase-1/3 small subunit